MWDFASNTFKLNFCIFFFSNFAVVKAFYHSFLQASESNVRERALACIIIISKWRLLILLPLQGEFSFGKYVIICVSE